AAVAEGVRMHESQEFQPMNVGSRDRRNGAPIFHSLIVVGVGCASATAPDKAILGGNVETSGSGSQNMSGGDGSVSDDAAQTGSDDGGSGTPGDDSGGGSDGGGATDDGGSATDDGGGSTGDDGGGAQDGPASTLNCSKATPCNGFTYVPGNFDPTAYSAPS